MSEIVDLLEQLLITAGMAANSAQLTAQLLTMLTVILIALLAHGIARGPLLRTIQRIVAKTNTQWDDALIERRVLHRLAHLAPGLIIYRLAPFILESFEQISLIVHTGAKLYLLLIGTITADALLSAGLDIYRTTNTSKEISIKSLVQFAKVILYFVAGLFALSILLNQPPSVLIGGLTALTAVLLLIFRDAILGLVAGIQLTVNRMVARGDWIEMPKYGADGDVLDVSLTTVKVQNWDKTITTIPSYALISESFRNWRGMKESGGRRIKRAINIDISSVSFCNEEMLARFSRIQYITEHIDRKKNALAKYNDSNNIDLGHLVNGRRMTNIGTFRAYIIAYLQNHPEISDEMTFLVRQLAPTDCGIPIEIYVFCKDTVWANYESIQADIFDHIFAITPEFDLRIFQRPSGADLNNLAQ
ncbi:MAG: mechanosensitive ion channel domain-containing protein [Candidatus Latescibacterota bacterium]|nr:mechanosensitive ion channel domain-containing protein [Candidatus Latescibacterota bacterium]